MKENAQNKKGPKAKNFFKGLVRNLDKKIEEKAKSFGCCCGDNSKNSSCCS